MNIFCKFFCSNKDKVVEKKPVPEPVKYFSINNKYLKISEGIEGAIIYKNRCWGNIYYKFDESGRRPEINDFVLRNDVLNTKFNELLFIQSTSYDNGRWIDEVVTYPDRFDGLTDYRFLKLVELYVKKDGKFIKL
jgi:hypothetical protein